MTINITEWVDDEIRQLPALSETIPIGLTLPHLSKASYFYRKGTNKRMRIWHDGRWRTVLSLRITDDCSGVCDHCRPSGEIDVRSCPSTSLHAQ